MGSFFVIPGPKFYPNSDKQLNITFEWKGNITQNLTARWDQQELWLDRWCRPSQNTNKPPQSTWKIMIARFSLVLVFFLWLSSFTEASKIAGRSPSTTSLSETERELIKLTNGQRIARGLPIARPKRFYDGTKTGRESGYM